MTTEQAIIELEISYEEEKEICDGSTEKSGDRASGSDETGSYNLRSARKKPSGASIRKSKAKETNEQETVRMSTKRQIVSPESIENDSKVKRHKNEQKKFSDVLKGNEVIVKFNNYPEALLDEKCVSALEKHLLRKIDFLKVGESAPQFHQRKLVDGMWKIKCIGQESKDWLCKVVDSVRLKGQSLHVINADELPTRPKCRVFVPGECSMDLIIMHRFKVQNADFDFASWRIVSNKRHFKFDGRNVVIELATESVDALKSRNWYLAYGLTQVRFHIIENKTVSGGINANTDSARNESNDAQSVMDYEELDEMVEKSDC